MQDQSVERRLAAILAADVVGYSRLMEADEAGTLACAQQGELLTWLGRPSKESSGFIARCGIRKVTGATSAAPNTSHASMPMRSNRSAS
jgi:class 3 adenylate cyclase